MPHPDPLFESTPWITATAPDDHLPAWPAAPWILPAPSARTLGEAFYRLSFHIPDPAAFSLAALRLAGRQRTDIHLNGRLLKRAVHWVGDYETDLLHHLKPGKNVLALHAIDRHNDQPAVAAALALRPSGQPPSADSFTLTGSEWKALPGGAPAEWTQVWFDDRPWHPAIPLPDIFPRRPSPPSPPRSVVLRKSFPLPSTPLRASVTVSALGLYHLRINNSPVTEDLLTPGWTEYDQRLEYQTFDITPLLRPGANLIEILLGNGWWLLHHPHFAATGRDTRLTAALRLEASLPGAAVLTLTTDTSWEARPSRILFNHLYHGETHDCAWSDDAAPPLPVSTAPCPALRLVPKMAEPIRCIARLDPIAIRRTPHGSWLADFGENLAGWVELPPPPAPAPRITVTHAELLRPDGTLNTDSLRTARAACRYLNTQPASGPLHPLFTYHGFRYAEIFGWPGGTPPAVKACLIHANLTPAGSFSCSDPLLNAIWDAARRAFRNNFHAVPTDCPQRDERLGWMADAGNIPDVAACFYDISRFFDKWAVDMQDAMAKSGYFPNFAPSTGQSERGSARGTPGWADAGVTVPWVLYQLYGRKDRLAAHYPAMRRHVETMLAESTDGLFTQKGWGDWLAVENSPQEPIGTAYFFRSTDFTARAAAALGHSADAGRFAALRETIRAAFQKAFYNPATASYATGAQTMNAMPLAFGITPPAERPRVLARLLADLEAHEWHLTTGFLGTTFLFDALAIERCHDIILRLLQQRDFPSLGRILDCGSTTITEAWNAHLGDDFASHDHFNLGAPAAWLLRHLAGLRPDLSHPGGRQLIFEPFFPQGITSASGAWFGPVGRAEISWQRDTSSSIRLTITVPDGAAATLKLPGLPPEPVSPGTLTRTLKLSPEE